MIRPLSLLRVSCVIVALVLSSATLFSSSKLIFPRFSFDDGTYTGLAIANLGAQTAKVTLTAYGVDGSTLTGPGFQNPVELEIPANQQVAKLISEVFKASLPANSIGWVELTSTADSITGFFLFLNGQLTQLDGADLPTAAQEIVFNLVRSGNGYSTELNLINPGPTDVTVSLSLYQPDQDPVIQEVSLPSRAVARQDAGTLFGLTAIDGASYLRATPSAGEIAGFEFVRSGSGDLLGLNARDADEALEKMVFPQMVVSGPWSSELGIVNYTDSPTLVTVSARRADGTLFGSDVLETNPITLGLEGNASTLLDLEEAFGFSSNSALDGWLEVEASDEAINGYISYGIPSVGSLAGVASVKEPLKTSVLSHMATGSGFFTGVALLNQTTLRANTRIVAMTPEGQILGSYDTVLQPGERISKLITELIDETANRTNGFVWIYSDLPLYASSLFGASSVLANVPSQEAPGEYKPDASLPTLSVRPPIAVVQPGRTQTFSVQGVPGTVTWSVNGVAGGSNSVGTIDNSGKYTAPGDRPQPSYITVTAESSNLKGGATVDILRAEELLSGLGVLQSIVYLRSLKQLFEVELISFSALEQGPSPASALQADNESELFEVAPTGDRTSVRTLDDNIVKMLSYTGGDGKEYILLLGQDSGNLIRFEPSSKQSRIVYTGLNQPTSMAFDGTTGNVLVAEADRITEVAKIFLDSGISATSASPGTGRDGVDESTVINVNGITGIEVNLCTGEIYYSVESEGIVYVYNRITGETGVLVSGLSGPGQLLLLYREDVPCPDSAQLLVAEPGADRISLVVPSLKAIVAWLPAPGIRDLVFIPAGSPYGDGRASIAYGLFFELFGAIGIVDVGDQYDDPPAVEEQPPCSGSISFDDPNLEAGVRQALGLLEDEAITCEAAASLTELIVPSREIVELGGIRFLENLEVLDLSNNLISNLAPVGALRKLQTLDASDNLIRSPGLSANLVELTSLDLSNNLISDLDTLVTLEVGTASAGGGRSARFQGVLPSLIRLNLSFNQISDIGALAQLLSIEELDLSGNFTISSIHALSGLTKLRILRLFQNAVSEIDAVAGMTALVILDLSSNQVTNLQPLLENPGLGEGDAVLLQSNPVASNSCAIIALLDEKGIEIDILALCAVDLDVSLSVQPDVAHPEDLLLYRARVRNYGFETAQGVTLRVSLPAGTAFWSARAGSGSCTTSLNLATCTWDAVPAGGFVDADLRVQVQSRTGQLETTASAAASVPELNMDNNQDALVIPLATADLAVSKTISNAAVTGGDPVVYTIEVENLGPDGATEVSILDRLPSGFSFQSASISSGTCQFSETGQTVRCDVSRIDVGVTATMTIQGNITLVSGQLVNSASASLREYDPDPLNNSDSVTATVNSPDLVVTKTDSVDPVTTGANLVYSIAVTSAGSVAATRILITDTLPAGVNLVSAALPGGTCTPLNQVVECTLASLAPGAGAVLTIDTLVTATQGVLTNSVTATMAELDANPADNTATEETTIAQSDLAVTKTASLEPAITGANLDYQIQVTNSGPDPATGVVLSDPLPTGVTFQSASSASCAEANGIVQCALGNLAAGQSVPVTITVRIDTLATSISNSASVTADQTDPNPANNTATVLSTVTQQTDLAITKTAAPAAIIGTDQPTFTITVTNNGPSDATGVTVTDVIPIDLFYDDFYSPASVAPLGSGTCNYNGLLNTLTCTFPSVPSGESRTVTIPTFASDIGTNDIDNTADVTGNETDPDASNNSATFTIHVQQADLAVTKTASLEPAITGADLDYLIQVTNNGPDPATNVLLYEPLPVGVTYQGDSLGNCTEQNGLVECGLGTLASGQTVPVTITVRVDALQGPLSNSVTVSADQVDPVSGNNFATVDSTVTQVTNLAITKTGSVSVVRPGDSLEFTITITNNGPSEATGVVMTDAVSSDLQLSQLAAPATVSPAGTGNCTLGDLLNEVQCTFTPIPSGASRIISMPVGINPEPSGALTIPNTATVAGNETDPDFSDNSSTYTLTFAQADLGVSFTSFPDINDPGPDFNYLIAVQNFGPDSVKLPHFTFNLSPAIDGYYTFGTPAVVPGLTQGSCSTGIASVTCDLDEIPAGGTVEISVSVTVNLAPLWIDVSAGVFSFSQEFDLNPDNNSDSVRTHAGTFPVIAGVRQTPITH